MVYKTAFITIWTIDNTNSIQTQYKPKKHLNRFKINPTPWQIATIKRPRLLIVGCGDVGQRLIKHLGKRVNHAQLAVRAVNRSVLPPKVNDYNNSNTPSARVHNLIVDLDNRHQVKRLDGLATWVVYLAPPPQTGETDSRLQHFLASTRGVKRLVYVSTTGVYGAAQGGWVHEHSPLAATEPRSRRRLAAERLLRRSTLPHTATLRAPGIYAANRLPIERIRSGQPAFIAADDVPTNHIHADDLARLCWLGLFKSKNRRAYNASDNQPMMHADYLQSVAQVFALPNPPKLSKDEVKAALSPIQWSMLSGAKRVSSQRLLTEWQVKLLHPNVQAFLKQLNKNSAN